MNIFIDGTWNTPKDNSNIARLHKTHGGEYFPGPGTGSFFMERVLGGAFGAGTDAIVDRAYKACSEPLNIFGFSRGAAAARVLAARWCAEGGTVAFLGCFDTVGAFGIPVNILGIPFQKINLFKDMRVNENVLRAAHVTALDEHRSAFVNTPMEEREGVTQTAVHGDHWYVGSSDETLGWMERQFYKARNDTER